MGAKDDKQLEAARALIRDLSERLNVDAWARLWDGTRLPLGKSPASNFEISIRDAGVIGALMAEEALAILDGDHVTDDAGTGFVHTAPSHGVEDFEVWRAAFNRDPVGLSAIGVRHHRIYRPMDDPNYVIVELDVETVEAVDAILSAAGELWNTNGESPALTSAPTVKVLTLVEHAAN